MKKYTQLKYILNIKYGLNVKNIYLHGGGFENEIYFAQTEKQKYTLRIYKSTQRKRSDVDFCYDVLEYLHRKKIPVQNPIKSLECEKAVEYRKKSIIQLLTYIEGKSASPITTLKIKDSGKILGKLHKVGLKYPWDKYTNKFNLLKKWQKTFYLNKISQAYKTKFKIPEYYQRKTRLQDVLFNLKKIKKIFNIHLKESSCFDTYGLIHGDYQPGNLVFKGNKVAGIFDFDLCVYGPLIWDLGFALAHFGFHMNNTNHEEICEAFIYGYYKEFKNQYYSKDDLKKVALFAMAERLSASIIYFTDYPSKKFWVDEVTYYHHKLSKLLI